jgi:hypothetical protein
MIPIAAQPGESARMSKTEKSIWLSAADRATLEGWIWGRNRRQKLVPGADSAAFGGLGWRDGHYARNRMSKVTVSRWQERYRAKAIAGLKVAAGRKALESLHYLLRLHAPPALQSARAA